MNTRLLVSFDQIRVSQPVTGENGRLLGFTREFPDRAGQFCFECTREQWAELQRFRWASPIIESGFLIPDVDFVAKDGTVFQDAAACLAHERALTVPAWKRALEDKQAGDPSDILGNHERVGWLEIDMIEIGSEETLLAILNAYEALIAYEIRDFGTKLVLFGTHPAFEFMQVPDDIDFYALPKYEVRDGAIVPLKECEGELDSSDPHKVASAGSIPAPPTISTPEEQPEITPEPEPETAPVELEEKPLYSRAWDKLEAKMRLGELAALLEVDVETLKASLQNHESTVELGHAGWVKRREPKT